MNERKRIAFLCHPYHRGGVTRWMADAAIAFAQKGWGVYFITVAPTRPFISGGGRETLIQLLQKDKAQVQIISEPVGWEFEFGTPGYRTFVYQRLLSKLPHGTPVILGDDNALWDAAAALHATYPMVGVLHADEQYYYALAEKHFRQVAALACVSERVHRNTLQRVPEINKRIVYTIPCGIHLPASGRTTNGADILQLVYVGRVSEYQKRTSDLVKIGALLHNSTQAFHLNIIGDGGEKASLENKFREAGLGPLITFHGWLSQKEVGKWLAAADILVLTSDFEGTPIAMMEALAAGCGMVGTRVSGIEDYELHPLAADCFAVFDVGNVEGAVKKIKKIATVPPSIRRIAARRLAETEFSMEVCLEKYIAVINSIKPAPVLPVAAARMNAGDMIYSRMLAFARYLKVSAMNRQKI